MSARRVLLWVLIAVIVLAFIGVGLGFVYRSGFGSRVGAIGPGFGRIPDGGRFIDMPHHFGMMPGFTRGIGFPFIGWVGPILLFALGVGVGLLLGGIGRNPSHPEPTSGGGEAGVPASFEAWHNQLHEQESQRPATKRARRS